MRDLRFMASIYGRQNRIAELFALWDAPPVALQKLFEDHAEDIMILQVDLAREGAQWQLLADRCERIVTQETQSIGNISHVCSVAWSVWSGLIMAFHHLYPKHE
jgi:N-terminal acetyltransferase B complex non-catalytic subunit